MHIKMYILHRVHINTYTYKWLKAIFFSEKFSKAKKKQKPKHIINQ